MDLVGVDMPPNPEIIDSVEHFVELVRRRVEVVFGVAGPVGDARVGGVGHEVQEAVGVDRPLEPEPWVKAKKFEPVSPAP